MSSKAPLNSLSGTQRIRAYGLLTALVYGFSHNWEERLLDFNAHSFKITTYNIPYWIDPVNSRNNIFHLREQDGADTSTVSVSLTAGVYTTSTFVTHLKSVLDTASPNSRTYTVQYDTIRDKFVISVNTGQFTLNFTTGQATSAALLMGFSPGNNYVSSSSGIVAAFPQQVTTGTEDCLLLCVAPKSIRDTETKNAYDAELNPAALVVQYDIAKEAGVLYGATTNLTLIQPVPINVAPGGILNPIPLYKHQSHIIRVTEKTFREFQASVRYPKGPYETSTNENFPDMNGGVWSLHYELILATGAPDNS